jgi:protoporphyrinogen/coproporphyrinogen III oxidase
LSVRAAFPTLWEAEERGKGSVIRGFFRRNKEEEDGDCLPLGDLVSRMGDVSVYTFQDGIETITNALRLYLKTRANVCLLAGVGVESIRMNVDGKIFEVNSPFSLDRSNY